MNLGPGLRIGTRRCGVMGHPPAHIYPDPSHLAVLKIKRESFLNIWQIHHPVQSHIFIICMSYSTSMIMLMIMLICINTTYMIQYTWVKYNAMLPFQYYCFKHRNKYMELNNWEQCLLCLVVHVCISIIHSTRLIFFIMHCFAVHKKESYSVVFWYVRTSTILWDEFLCIVIVRCNTLE